MGLKSFLKPSVSKVAVFEFIMIIYLLSNVFSLYSSTVAALGLSGICYTGYSNCISNENVSNFEKFNETVSQYADIINKPAPYSQILTLNMIRFFPLEDVSVLRNLPGFVFVFIYWYLISCILVWLFGLINSNKRNNVSNKSVLE